MRCKNVTYIHTYMHTFRALPHDVYYKPICDWLYYLAVSFSSRHAVLEVFKLHNQTTKNAQFGLPTLLYG